MVVSVVFSTGHKKPLSNQPDKSGQPKGAVLPITIGFGSRVVNIKTCTQEMSCSAVTSVSMMNFLNDQ